MHVSTILEVRRCSVSEISVTTSALFLFSWEAERKGSELSALKWVLFWFCFLNVILPFSQ